MMSQEQLLKRFSYAPEWQALKEHRNAILYMANLKDHELNFQLPMKKVVNMVPWELSKQDVINNS